MSWLGMLPVAAEARVRSRVSPGEFVVDRMVLDFSKDLWWTEWF